MNIGELFVSLGFDVDETKLKEFNDKIVAGRNEMIKMTAVAAGATYALSAFLEKSVHNAVSIRNMTNELGVNGEALSKWQTLVRLTNPAMGAEQALDSYRKLIDYLRQASLGKGAGALNMLGVNYEGGDENRPEKVVKELQAAIPGVLASGRFNRSQLSGFLSEIFGTSGVLNALMKTPQEANALVAGKYQTQEQIDAAAALADRVAALGVQWDAFANKMTAKWGPSIIAVLEKIDHEMEKWLPVIAQVIDAIGGIKTIAEVVFGYLTIRWAAGLIVMLSNVTKAFGVLGASVAGVGAAGFASLGIAGRLGVLGAAGYGGFELGKWLAEKSGVAQGIADWWAPVKTPNVEHFLNPKSGQNIEINQNTTQHIHSSADAEEVGGHVIEHLKRDQQSGLNGIGIQLNQGPAY